MLRSLTIVALLAVLTTPASSQILWDSPPLISPAVPGGLSLFMLNPAGGDLGGLATVRHSAGPVGLGYRAAVAQEDTSGDLSYSAGLDVSGYLARAVEGSEVDVIWWGGGGVGVGSETVVTAPLGIILGWSGSGGDVTLSPYVGGHVVFDISTQDAESVGFAGVLDLGLDIVLPSGWMVRAGASLGDRDALALGVKIPGGG
ncbi:MAG: hypothetical protein VX801_03180 [Gemmatimonadota bacterium]|nr:hypothetical protein [Gemmatimonadota bacterium]